MDQNHPDPGSQSRLAKTYSKFFSLDEIKANNRLLWLWWGIIALIIYDMGGFSRGHDNYSMGNSCWVYFQNCHEYWPFKNFPESYSYNNFIMLLGALVCLNIFLLLSKRVVLAHFVTLTLMLWKFFFHFILRDTGWQNFEYFMQVPTFVFLFCPKKLNAVRITWAMLLMMSAQVKFHEAWATGSYFTTLELGLPVFSSFLSKEFIPLISNSVIFLEIWGAFALLAKSPKVRKLSFFVWVIFHIYSISLVSFHYPVRCLIFLIVGFWGVWREDARTWNPYRDGRSLRLGFALILVLAVNLGPKWIGSDTKFTFEGLGFGFFMFDSNHQCLIQTESFDTEGNSLAQRRLALLFAMNRCDPWHQLQVIRKECKRPGVSRVSYIHDHSYNGSPFYRMVDEENACQLEYQVFSRNTWIKDISEDPEIIGYPYPNQTQGRVSKRQARGLPVISPEPVIEKPKTQIWLTENLGWLLPLYWFYWLAELSRVLLLLIVPGLFSRDRSYLKNLFLRK